MLFALLLGEKIGLGHWIGGALMALASALVMGLRPGRRLVAALARNTQKRST